MAGLPHRLDGLILELRALGQDRLDLSEWPSFALSVFDLIVLINAVDEREADALSKAMLAQRTFDTDLGDDAVTGIFKQAREMLAELGKEKVAS